MANWISGLSERFKGSKKQLSVEEAVVLLMDEGDPRVVFRPLGNDWLCPFSFKRLHVPEWDGSSITLLDQPVVYQHLLGLPLIQQQREKAEMKSWDALLRQTIAIRLRECDHYHVATDKGNWICPHCASVTDVLLEQWDGTLAPMDWFVPQAFQHLDKCPAYQADPLNPKTREEISSAQGEGGVRMELLKRVANDPLFRVCDDMGTWICPFSKRPIDSINIVHVPWGSAIQTRIVEYILSNDCPARYSAYKPAVTLAELQRIAGKVSSEKSRSAEKRAAEAELTTLRQRVDELGQRAATAEEMEHDLEAARKVQMKMLPSAPPKIPGYDIAAFYQPCVQLGGDLYHFLDVAPGFTGLLVGDVSGHGVAAAVIMAMAQKSFGVRATKECSSKAVMNMVNGDLVKDMPRGRFVSAFYGILEHATGTLTCSRGGHPPGYIVKADGQILPLEGDGLALGLGSPALFTEKLQEYQVELPENSMLVLYTDGIPEAMDAQKNEFTEERLRAVIAECATLSAKDAILYILSAVREHTGQIAMEDDLTIVAVRRLPSPA